MYCLTQTEKQSLINQGYFTFVTYRFVRYFVADNEDSNINKPPRRAHLDLVNEAKLVTLAELYKDGVITYNVFVDKVIDFYDFNRAKLVRMSEDGKESDDMSSS